MTPQTVTYTRRMPMEQYGYAEMTSTATVGDDETPLTAFMALKAEVEKAVAMEVSAATEPEIVEEKPAKKAKKAAKVEVAAEEDEEEVAPVKAAKKTKAKTSNYSRSNETHKAMFADALNNSFPSWKKTDAGKSKAKKLSQDLDGTEFLDASGEILESFLDAMAEGMS